MTITQALAQFLPLETWFGAFPPASEVPESGLDYLSRLKDEVLWPRILVRHAPPPGEIQPMAPDRF